MVGVDRVEHRGGLRLHSDGSGGHHCRGTRILSLRLHVLVRWGGHCRFHVVRGLDRVEHGGHRWLLLHVGCNGRCRHHIVRSGARHVVGELCAADLAIMVGVDRVEHRGGLRLHSDGTCILSLRLHVLVGRGSHGVRVGCDGRRWFRVGCDGRCRHHVVGSGARHVVGELRAADLAVVVGVDRIEHRGRLRLHVLVGWCGHCVRVGCDGRCRPHVVGGGNLGFIVLNHVEHGGHRRLLHHVVRWHHVVGGRSRDDI